MGSARGGGRGGGVEKWTDGGSTRRRSLGVGLQHVAIMFLPAMRDSPRTASNPCSRSTSLKSDLSPRRSARETPRRSRCPPRANGPSHRRAACRRATRMHRHRAGRHTACLSNRPARDRPAIDERRVAGRQPCAQPGLKSLGVQYVAATIAGSLIAAPSIGPRVVLRLLPSTRTAFVPFVFR